MSAGSILAAAALTGLAVVAAPQRRRAVVQGRLARLPTSVTVGERSEPPVAAHPPATRRLAPGVTGLVVAVAVGGLPGVLTGTVAAVAAAWALGRIEPTAVRRRRERLAADLPVATDLLAACLAAGAAVTDAADAVGDAVGGPVAEELRGATARIRLGADPAAVWRSLAGATPLGPLARALARAATSGAPLAETLTRIADQQRAARRRSAFAGAQRIAVWAAAPLGLCFLPAFVLLGVVPLIAGILTRVLSF